MDKLSIMETLLSEVQEAGISSINEKKEIIAKTIEEVFGKESEAYNYLIECQMFESIVISGGAPTFEELQNKYNYYVGLLNKIITEIKNTEI